LCFRANLRAFGLDPRQLLQGELHFGRRPKDKLVAGAGASGGDGLGRKNQNTGGGSARSGDVEDGEGLDRLDYRALVVKVEQVER